MEYDIVIKNTSVLNADFEIPEHMTVAIKDGKIARIVKETDMGVFEAARVMDGEGKLVMPGLVDAHTHTCQQLLRGRLADEFPMIWMRFLVPFEGSLQEEDVYHSARLYCLQAIKSGITAFADSGGRHMHKVAQAVTESGMRAVLSRSMMDMGNGVATGMVEETTAAIDNNDRLFDEFHDKADGRLRVFYGIRQVMACSPELIKLVAKHANERNTGIHAHLCEHRDEVSFCLQNYKMRPAELLDHCGALGPDLLTAHNVALSEKDITLLQKQKVKLVHCPFANITNHGFPKTPRLLETGCVVGLGSDGAAYYSLDLFEELRVLRAAMIGNWGLPVFDPAVLTVRDALGILLNGGAAAIGHANTLGAVEEGRIADLITINIRQPHIFPTNNLTTAILDCVSAQDVCDSIINGKLVMENRRVLAFDENAVMEECGKRMKTLC